MLAGRIEKWWLETESANFHHCLAYRKVGQQTLMELVDRLSRRRATSDPQKPLQPA